MAQEPFPFGNIRTSRPPMHKVHSSPSLCSFNNAQTPMNINPNSKHHVQQRHYHYQQNQMQQQHHSGYQSPRLPQPQDFNRISATERVSISLAPSPPTGRVDAGRSLIAPNINHFPPSRQQRGIGSWNKYGYSDEYAVNGGGRIDRTENQWSPR